MKHEDERTERYDAPLCDKKAVERDGCGLFQDSALALD
jgi:hypothetical protein